MKYSDELKVGLALVVAALVFVLGLRYFQDLPLFETTDSYYSLVENAAGITSGSPVRVNGVSVGAVRRVGYDADERQVRVDFYVEQRIRITEGSSASITGFSAIGDVKLDLSLGPADNERIPRGGLVPSHEEDFFGDIADRAPALVNRADSLMIGMTSTMSSVSRLLEEPDSDFRKTLQSVERTSDQVNRVLREEQQRLAATLDSVAHLTGSLNRIAEGSEDEIEATLQDVQHLIKRLDSNLDSVERSTDRLDNILEQIESGEGTLGLLVNDPQLYHRMDSTVVRLHELIDDFQQNPRRYLKELKLIDIF